MQEILENLRTILRIYGIDSLLEYLILIMQKEDVLKSLREEMPTIKEKFGVKSIGLFGSYAKNLQNEESDIDLLVDLDAPLSSNFFGLWDHLENYFDKKIDLTRKGKHLIEKF